MRELDKLRKLLEPRQLRWAPALALPLTTSVLAQVVCERNWSIYGHTKTNKLAHGPTLLSTAMRCCICVTSCRR